MAADPDLPCPWWSEDLLRREYVDRGRSKNEIARRWGTTWDTIDRWIRRHGITRP